jgi:hypothetical protein
MSKIIKLTESELIYLIKDIITESLEKKINNGKITSTIKNKLGVKDLSSGNFVLKIGGGGGLIIKHLDFDKNKKQITISINDQSGIPDKGRWSISGTYLTLKKN